LYREERYEEEGREEEEVAFGEELVVMGRRKVRFSL